MRRRLLAGCTLVAIVATVGSLYFSEIANLSPCPLCWYQRILMYPLVVIFGVATFENRPAVWKTALPLSGLGIGVSAYHTVLQLTPTAQCSVGIGCGTIQWQGLAVFTIPRLALLAFVLITAGSVVLVVRDRQ
ncbi:disulfide bond formation protein DsbB [Halohasta litchfieldiae]|uniref:Disulfide bond formation protein DsbB n=1 Tax=Halohasta litchfieldiae TaxID=1073996 RepID=A0A1H6X8Q0_9EURY|nr:disulfide bond formation protein B [Halohasta litchfieldiae]ATW90092.1 disulfide bond formation protein DsbB [Halohasta litchfieldiae]SEJ20945.1 disulfide bond formation protein DsbB [Halohasta litchfieldiae]